MSFADLLEHWACIYRGLNHDPHKGSEDQSFFLLRYLDKESGFGRNANSIKSPSMAYSVLVSGKFDGAKTIRLAHQVWFMMRNDTTDIDGRHDERSVMDAHEQMQTMAEDLIQYLVQVKRTGVCPVTKRDFRCDAVLYRQICSIDMSDVEFGSIPDFMFAGNWSIFGVDFHTLKPLVQWECDDAIRKYFADQCNDNEG